MGFLSFFTFCVRLRCVLFFSSTNKVPFLIKNVYQNGTSRLIIYKNPPLVKPFFNFFYKNFIRNFILPQSACESDFPLR